MLDIPFYRNLLENDWALFGHGRVTQHTALSRIIPSGSFPILLSAEHPQIIIQIIDLEVAQVLESMASELGGLYSWRSNPNGEWLVVFQFLGSNEPQFFPSVNPDSRRR